MDPNNYRGISLLSVVGKIFTKIINTRVTQWAEDSRKLHEEQAGYRKTYSCVDQIFNLQSVVQKYLTKRRGRFYCAFIDFSKAFDSIPHVLLWYRLLKTGLHGRVMTVFMDMYKQSSSCVLTPEGLSEFFTNSVGTRQGCLLSPIFFVLYLNSFIEMCKTLNGVYINEDFPNLNGLLYADDLAELADTVGRLQALLNCLQEFCAKWGLNVNINKTKTLIFRNGVRLRQN